MAFFERLKSAWNAFTSRDPTVTMYGQNFYNPVRPDKQQLYYSNEQSIITTVQNRIAVDVASIEIHHARTDENGLYKEDVDSSLNDRLLHSANIDQSGRAFIQDLTMSMLINGHAVAVPIDTDIDPESGKPWEVYSMRVGRVVEWYSDKVKVLAHDQQTNSFRTLIADKKAVAIIENPFYSIMNEPNSTLKRLTRTLHNLDTINNEMANGRLNAIVKLPYSIRSPLRQQQADLHIKQLERQLNNPSNKIGIGFIEQAEEFHELNRPLVNNLWEEARDLTTMLYNQLGLTPAIIDHTANEQIMNNYITRTIEPIVAAICDEMTRKFLTDEDIKDGQCIVYVRDPFKLISVSSIAQIAQTMSANEIMSSNEIRTKIGLPPSKDERADELLNKQINQKQPPGENEATQHNVENQTNDAEISSENS